MFIALLTLHMPWSRLQSANIVRLFLNSFERRLYFHSCFVSGVFIFATTKTQNVVVWCNVKWWRLMSDKLAAKGLPRAAALSGAAAKSAM